MARPKKAPEAERRTVRVELYPLTYYAYRSPALPGITGVGETPEKALSSMRAAVRNHYPHSHFDIEEVIQGETVD